MEGEGGSREIPGQVGVIAQGCDSFSWLTSRRRIKFQCRIEIHGDDLHKALTKMWFSLWALFPCSKYRLRRNYREPVRSPALLRCVPGTAGRSVQKEVACGRWSLFCALLHGQEQVRRACAAGARNKARWQAWRTFNGGALQKPKTTNKHEETIAPTKKQNKKKCRTYYGDRFHHLHSRDIEDAELTTISDLLNRTVDATDIPLSAFVAAGVTVCGADCTNIGVSEADLSDSFTIAWEVGYKQPPSCVSCDVLLLLLLFQLLF